MGTTAGVEMWWVPVGDYAVVDRKLAKRGQDAPWECRYLTIRAISLTKVVNQVVNGPSHGPKRCGLMVKSVYRKSRSCHSWQPTIFPWAKLMQNPLWDNIKI